MDTALALFEMQNDGWHRQGQRRHVSYRVHVAWVSKIVLCTFIFLPGCKKDQPEPAVPVEKYIQPDQPPTFTHTDGNVKTAIHLKDITASAGIKYKHETGAFGQKWMPETMGGGGAFFDYNGDHLPDILFINSSYWSGHESAGAKPVSRLFVNRSKPGQVRFEDMTDHSGLSKIHCYGMGSTIADYDGDGDQDIYITAVGKNHLLRNDAGRFVDVTDAAGVGFSSHLQPPSLWEWSTGSVWVDYDRDGDLDLFVANYVQWTPETDIYTTLDGKIKTYATPQPYQGSSCTLFRNEGQGQFIDVTKLTGVYNPDGKSLSVITDDFNDDGWPDLVVTNDTQPNFLYINNKDGTFSDEALMAGIAYDENGLARAGMGVGICDMRNQGLRSIAIGNFSGEPLSLYTQAGEEMFIDQAGMTRLTKPTMTSLTFGVHFLDINLDGFEDLVLANGHIEPEIASVHDGWLFAQPPQLFLNNRAGKFVLVTDQAGDDFASSMVGRAVASADIDSDGDIDLLITANGGSPRLLRNDTTDLHHAVRIFLIGSGANKQAIGSRIRAHVGKNTQTRYITTGGSYLSQSESTATFGLGDANQIDTLHVRWPDGSLEKFINLKAGSTYHIQMRDGIVHSEPFRR